MLKHVQVFLYKNSLVYQYKVSFLLSIQGVTISDYEWTHDKKNQAKLLPILIIKLISSLWMRNAHKEEKTG